MAITLTAGATGTVSNSSATFLNLPATDYDATSFSLTDSSDASNLYRYYGKNFTYDEGGNLLSGTIERAELYHDGAVYWQMEGFSLDGLTFINNGKQPSNHTIDTLFDLAFRTDAVHLTGGNAADLLISVSDDDDIVKLRGGDDFVFTNDGDDFVNGNAGDDQLEGQAGNDTLRGGKGDDLIGYPVEQGTSNVFGAGDDQLLGDLGNDTLYGGSGNDTLTGGQGHDNFQFVVGDLVGGVSHDTITDFTFGEDVLEITATAGNHFIGRNNTGEAVIVLSDGQSTITLSGIQAEGLELADLL